MQNTFKKGIGDRYDGWRVRNVDAVFNVIPFIMRTRLDSQNLFEENIPIENIEKFIRKHREDMPNLTFMHVIIASLVRMIAVKPYLNRFIIWNRIYARNSITISLMIKRKHSNVETNVKPEFAPTATLKDVVDTMSELVNENIDSQANNNMDKIAGLFGYIPAFLLRFVIWLVRWMDNFGIMPRFIEKISPFHSSAFLTNVGSVGIGPIYHHLYEFGTCSFFTAMGTKHKFHTVNSNGEREEKRFIGLKFVTDERICDGEYYANAMKVLRRLLNDPELLMVPPENVPIDDGVPARKLRVKKN